MNAAGTSLTTWSQGLQQVLIRRPLVLDIKDIMYDISTIPSYTKRRLVATKRLGGGWEVAGRWPASLHQLDHSIPPREQIASLQRYDLEQCTYPLHGGYIHC